MNDLDSNYKLVNTNSVRIKQAGFREKTFSASELRKALETEKNSRRALALQEALDMLINAGVNGGQHSGTSCVCLEYVGDNGYCPEHGLPDGGRS